MNNLPDLFDSERAQRPQGEASPEEILEDYLDHLCAPLLGVVEYKERCKLRLQAFDQLQTMIEEFEAGGMSSQEALLQAMRQHGEPWQIGKSFAVAWQDSPPSTSYSCGPPRDSLRSFAFFGLPAVAALLLVEQHALTNTPYPDVSLRLLCILGPIVAGALIGANVALHTVRPVCSGLLPLILVSIGAGIQLLPDPVGLQLGLFQFLFWLPAGCASSWIATHCVLSLRRQYFVRSAYRVYRALRRG